MLCVGAVVLLSCKLVYAKALQIETYATLIPVNEAELSSDVTAKITAIYYQAGDQFDKGDKLVQFDCTHIEAEISKIKAKLKLAEVTLRSNLKLQQLNGISDIDLAKSQSEYDQIKADLTIWENKQKNCTIYAPYSGEVIALFANNNEVVKADDPVIGIVNNYDLDVQMYLPSKWLNQLKIGSQFQLKLKEVHAHIFTGNITKIIGRIDPASQSMLVIGKLGDSSGYTLFSGMSGVAHFKVDAMENSDDKAKEK